MEGLLIFFAIGFGIIIFIINVLFFYNGYKFFKKAYNYLDYLDYMRDFIHKKFPDDFKETTEYSNDDNSIEAE